MGRPGARSSAAAAGMWFSAAGPVALPVQRTARGKTRAIEDMRAPEPGKGLGQIPRMRDPEGERPRRGPSQ